MINEITKALVLKGYTTVTRYPICYNCQNISFDIKIPFVRKCKLTDVNVEPHGTCPYYENIYTKY